MNDVVLVVAVIQGFACPSPLFTTFVRPLDNDISLACYPKTPQLVTVCDLPRH